MKKLLLTALIASMLIVPLGNTALADHEEAPASEAVQDYIPGDVPAETAATESMLPAVHGLVLAALNHDTARFDLSDSELAWEGLYNMLSLYGQLDDRCGSSQGELALPEETVQDYAAALGLRTEDLEPLPAGMKDRINYDSASRCYIIVCGEADLNQLQLDGLQTIDDSLVLSGTLADLAEGGTLARFQAVLEPQDNMFGFVITSLTVSG